MYRCENACKQRFGIQSGKAEIRCGKSLWPFPGHSSVHRCGAGELLNSHYVKRQMWRLAPGNAERRPVGEAHSVRGFLIRAVKKKMGSSGVPLWAPSRVQHTPTVVNHTCLISLTGLNDLTGLPAHYRTTSSSYNRISATADLGCKHLE
jgi:hypothetical protein